MPDFAKRFRKEVTEKIGATSGKANNGFAEYSLNLEGGNMKAEDTVISWERIRMVLQKQDELLQHDPMFRLEAIAKAQAEISFKAGIKEGYNRR